jgi:hypothetical protein
MTYHRHFTAIKDGTASIILIMQAKDKIITSAGLTIKEIVTATVAI